ncbi:hypothetical protein TRIATDRAFT_85224 [Trichoderma atroviride IMI 206040]|uniref:Uncharacterized protein n=1 Tax=Hypocrea atroviridis (strain ATCC 20476 / IMI 206040) TaxID=452589 RepID=G9P8D6_HYPAI|nr:uncharacterized protein TRIATDRAFT_85224 [Trichoderma atroviride IMI 206040]EHK40929.1 hypothetical protein TRIATDRAFT_85224 [Trichoderma atroviride IMI 206040]
MPGFTEQERGATSYMAVRVDAARKSFWARVKLSWLLRSPSSIGGPSLHRGPESKSDTIAPCKVQAADQSPHASTEDILFMAREDQSLCGHDLLTAVCRAMSTGGGLYHKYEYTAQCSHTASVVVPALYDDARELPVQAGTHSNLRVEHLTSRARMESAQPIAGAGHACNAPLRDPSPHVSTDLEERSAETTSFSSLFVDAGLLWLPGNLGE